MRGILILLMSVAGHRVPAYAGFGSHPRVDADLASYDRKVAEMQKELERFPADPKDKEWVRRKIAHMVQVDQFMRNYIQVPHQRNYSQAEREYFSREFHERWSRVDGPNTADLKKLLEIYPWFTVSEFGRETAGNAWLLVQHADHDLAFQKVVLEKLERLYPVGEASPSNYAYLYDRVAVNGKSPQRYGTQGRCTGPGTWEPLPPIEKPRELEARRKAMGLEPMNEHKKRFKDICHGPEGF